MNNQSDLEIKESVKFAEEITETEDARRRHYFDMASKCQPKNKEKVKNGFAEEIIETQEGRRRHFIASNNLSRSPSSKTGEKYKFAEEINETEGERRKDTSENRTTKGSRKDSVPKFQSSGRSQNPDRNTKAPQFNDQSCRDRNRIPENMERETSYGAFQVDSSGIRAVRPPSSLASPYLNERGQDGEQPVPRDVEHNTPHIPNAILVEEENHDSLVETRVEAGIAARIEQLETIAVEVVQNPDDEPKKESRNGRCRMYAKWSILLIFAVVLMIMFLALYIPRPHSPLVTAQPTSYPSSLPTDYPSYEDMVLHLKFGSHSDGVGYSVVCGDRSEDVIEKRLPPAFIGAEGKEKTAILQVPTDRECTVDITHQHGIGLQPDGFLRMYQGKDISDKSPTIVDIPGNFTYLTSQQFELSPIEYQLDCVIDTDITCKVHADGAPVQDCKHLIPQQGVPQRCNYEYNFTFVGGQCHQTPPRYRCDDIKEISNESSDNISLTCQNMERNILFAENNISKGQMIILKSNKPQDTINCEIRDSSTRELIQALSLDSSALAANATYGGLRFEVASSRCEDVCEVTAEMMYTITNVGNTSFNVSSLERQFQSRVQHTVSIDTNDLVEHLRRNTLISEEETATAIEHRPFNLCNGEQQKTEVTVEAVSSFSGLPCQRTTSMHALPPDTARLPPLSVFIDITLDSFPLEIGWNLTCNGELKEFIPPRSYIDPNTLIQKSYAAKAHDTCTFSIVDTAEDGICCTNGAGSFSVGFRNNIMNNSTIVESGDGQFEAGTSVTFQVLPPI